MYLKTDSIGPGYRGVVAGLVGADAGVGVGAGRVGGALATAPPYPVHGPSNDVACTSVVAHVVPAIQQPLTNIYCKPIPAWSRV